MCKQFLVAEVLSVFFKLPLKELKKFNSSPLATEQLFYRQMLYERTKEKVIKTAKRETSKKISRNITLIDSILRNKVGIIFFTNSQENAHLSYIHVSLSDDRVKFVTVEE